MGVREMRVLLEWFSGYYPMTTLFFARRQAKKLLRAKIYLHRRGLVPKFQARIINAA